MQRIDQNSPFSPLFQSSFLVVFLLFKILFLFFLEILWHGSTFYTKRSYCLSQFEGCETFCSGYWGKFEKNCLLYDCHNKKSVASKWKRYHVSLREQVTNPFCTLLYFCTISANEVSSWCTCMSSWRFSKSIEQALNRKHDLHLRRHQNAQRMQHADMAYHLQQLDTSKPWADFPLEGLCWRRLWTWHPHPWAYQ